MNYKKITILTLFVILLCLTGCSKEKYYIPKYALDIMKTSAEYLENNIDSIVTFDGMYNEVYADKNGNLVFETTDAQSKELYNYFKNDVISYIISLAQLGCEIDYNETFTEIVIECKTEQFGKEISEETLDSASALLMCCQSNYVDNSDEIKVYAYIKDIDTGELLLEKQYGDIIDDLTEYYIPKEVADMRYSTSVTTVADIDIMNYYEGMVEESYFDSEGNFIMRLTSSQKNDWLEATEISLELQNISLTNVSISYSSDYKDVIIYCDDGVYGDTFTEYDVYDAMIIASNYQTFLGVLPDNNLVIATVEENGKVIFNATLSDMKNITQ